MENLVKPERRNDLYITKSLPKQVRTCLSSGGWDLNPRPLGYEPSELTGLLYPAILKLTSITSYHTLWWIKGSEHNPHITNHFPEIICANAAPH